MRHQRNGGRKRHGADADGIDVVEMGALELDARWGKAERLVDEQIGRDGAEPGHGDDGKNAERFFQQAIDAEFHQQQRDHHVEDQPDHAAGMAVGEAGEEVGPGERARIGVHDVDLQLRDHHEGDHQQHGRRMVGDHVAEGGQVHLGRIGGAVHRDAGTEGQDHEEGTGQQLRHAHDDPASTGQKDRDAMAQTALALGGQEAQEIHLFADLRHQREDDGRRRAEFHQIEMGHGARRTGGVMNAGKGPPQIVFFPVHQSDEDEGQYVQHDPEGLGDDLETADEAHAMGDERNDHDGGDDVADPQGNAERQLQRAGHDRRLDGEEHEGEGGVDQRGDGGADVTEARAACQEIDIDAVADGVTADRQADGKHGNGRDDDGVKGVGGAV
ncbi:hypothetical protein D3C87_1103940 [compost metagenome]